ncbi:MAG: hypothetical protein IIA83_08430, partial [Thaumarchaeota archaeon]|nr:hypothetical protein [Nitrososphaerota archaeon]
EIKKYDEETLQTVPHLLEWIKENKITRIESDTKKIYLRAHKERIGGKRGSETADSLLLSRERGLKERVLEYEFRQSVKNYKKKEFYKLLTKYPYDDLHFCDHFDESFDESNAQQIKPMVVVSQDEERRFIFHERTKSLAQALSKREPESNLQLLCDDCYKRIDKLCCTNAIVKKSVGYEPNHSHNFDDILLRLILKKNNVNFDEFAEERFGRIPTQFYLKDFNALLTRKHREIENIVEKLNPETIILQGNKHDIIDYLKYDTNLIIFDDSKEVKQRFFLFDKNKKVESSVEKCCLHLIQNLENYSDEIRGKEHDKLIGALEKIGKELGFIPQREVKSKGSRVDLVWLDRNGEVFSAIEVETSAQWKKDVVTTWEIEPKLAIILSHYKSEKGIKDILQYVLLKEMPHKLLFINNTTKKGYLIEKQDLIHYYDIAKKQEIESEVFEY